MERFGIANIKCSSSLLCHSGKSVFWRIRNGNKMLKILLVLIWITVVGKNVFSSDSYSLQDNRLYKTRHLTITDGLPSNTITAIVKDNQGYLWFGTTDGLCRWDGASAAIFRKDPADSTSIIGNSIPRNGLIWDEKHNNLIIGMNEGISIFNPLTKLSRNYFVDPTNSGTLTAAVNAVLVDRQGIIWAGTDNGFSRFNAPTEVFFNYLYQGKIPDDAFLDRISINMIHDICQDVNNDSVLWIASLAGLLKFNKHTEIINWFYYPDNDYLREINQFNLIVPHSNGELFIGTWNFDMVVFDTKSEKFTRRYGPLAQNEPIISSRIVPFAIRPDGNIWISSKQGIGIFEPQSGNINFIQSFKNDKGHFFAPELYFIDNEGHLWLGSSTGVFILNPVNQWVKNYFIDPLDEEHWYLTLSLFEDTLNNEILVGYGRGEGLHYFNLETNKFGVVSYEQRIISEYNLTEITGLQNGKILFLTSDEIYQYTPDGKRTRALNYPYNHFPSFTDIKQDASGRIWVASSTMGLQQYFPENNTVRNIRNWSHIFTSGHQHPLFAELYIDTQNRIWFRRRGESYGYYNPETDSLCYFSGAENRFDLTCFGEILNDTLWVATATQGIGFIDLNNADEGVKLINFRNATETGVIGDMIFDQQGRIWCLKENGLLCINTNTGASVLFDENYGIPLVDDWSDRGALIPGQLKLLSNGQIAIGYRRGLGFFHPDSLRVSCHTPEPYFMSIRIFDEEISPGNIRQLKLPYRKNYFTVRYSALELYCEGISFRHQLSGVDLDWQENQELNEVTYANLQPGSYQFCVQAVLESGLGETKELVLNFRILPPWWKTVWAYIAFFIIAFLSFYLFYRFQINRHLAKRETLRLLEMDELKTRLYANITHEFRTPITLIMGLAEELKLSNGSIKKKQFEKKLETIHRSGGNLLHLVNQMLDLAKLEHGNLKIQPILSDIIPWLQYVVESHQSLASSKEIQLTFYPETHSLKMNYDPDQLLKVVSNLLVNAIKFTEIRGKVICHAKYVTSDKTFHFKVMDNGIGIPEEEQSKIFDRFYQVESKSRNVERGTGIGLSLTKEIVEQLGGIISLKSQPGKGSVFEIVLPVLISAPEILPDELTSEKPLMLESQSEDQFEKEHPEDFINGSEKPLVLLTEDNPDVAGYICEIISAKYRVKWASDGEKGLQMAFEMIPDLVITDVMMPGKDGFEVCNTLKLDERTNHIPVVMLTAKVTDADRISGFERGADAYLTKPFNKKELLVRLEQLLKLRRKLQDKFRKLEIIQSQANTPTPAEQFILKALKIVESNLDESSFNATGLANEVNLSESQLYRKLKAISGKSTAIFIRTVRLKKAKELLISSNLSVSEIAYEVGFNDPAWFSRVFKDEFGISPTEAREN